MAPPCHSFPVKELPLAVQANLDGRLRKTEDGRRIDLLRDCELLKLLQYECVVTNPELHSSPIQCWPVQRLFRRCQDKKGKFTVETTAWEEVPEAGNSTTAYSAQEAPAPVHKDSRKPNPKVDKIRSP